MPRVLAHTPGWLARPSPGFDVFAAPPHKSTPAPAPVRDASAAPTTPARLIARWGTQVFVAVENEVRWTDLVLLQDYDQGRAASGRRGGAVQAESAPESIYRVLKLGSGISGRITQLIISPFGDYMAVVTSHTVHIVVLHNHNHYELDIAPAPLKTFHLGPSQHVLERSPLVSVLWHPLSPAGRCLVTVTEDAVVRLWDLDRENRSSFQQCELSIDLGRLANAGSAQDNLSASEFGRGTSYMPDRAYVQPSAATFGGRGRAGENPWAAMTLWLSTREGDLYALCPLIPPKFRAIPGFFRILWDSVGARRAELDQSSTDAQRHQVEQQEEWLRKVEQVGSITMDNPDGELVDVFSRPKQPRPETFLQGPFEMMVSTPPITDMQVRNIALGEESLEFDTGEILEDDEDDDAIPLETSVILLISESATVHVLLNLQSVEGRWFDAQYAEEELEDDVVLHIDTFATHATDPSGKKRTLPSFTPDPMSQYGFFVTNASGVSYFSLESWIERLRDELEEPTDTGLELRAELATKNVKPQVEQLIKFPVNSVERAGSVVSSALALFSEDLGYMALASYHGQPLAVTLDTKYREAALNESVMSQSGRISVRSEPLMLPAPPVRSSYAADNVLWDFDDIPKFLKELPARVKFPLHQNSQLTTDTLDGFIQAHQAFSKQSQQISRAAAGIFQACDRMLNEYHDQIQRVRELTSQIESITGEDDDTFSEEIETSGHLKLSRRLEDARERQERIIAQAKAVSRKLGILGGDKQSSEKQKQFAAEVQSLASQLRLDPKKHQNGTGSDDEDSFLEAPDFIERFDEVKALAKEIKLEGSKLGEQNGMSSPRRRQIPHAIRREKMDQVHELLEQESSIVEATAARLQKLSVQL